MSQPIEQQSRQSVTVGVHLLEGLLLVPAEPKGIVIFAHGSDSSRFSSRNTFVARELSKRGHATLLFDLLTEEEARQRTNVFDIFLLAGRVVEAIDAVRAKATTRDLPVGLFGASTGAAAALVAAAQRPEIVSAVVSRGGRPDLASGELRNVRAPTMLIVGSRDLAVLELNRLALEEMTCIKGLHVVRGATHLFEEAGALEEVLEAAAFWFRVHLGGSDVERC
jgi:pimeloyl-ACP methyl ester carboxylesterase